MLQPTNSSNAPVSPSPSPVHVLRGHTSPVNAIKFTSCGSFLVSGTTEGELKLWNVTTKRNLCSVQRPSGIVALHCITPSNMVSHEAEGTIAVWDNAGPDLHVTSQWNPYFDSALRHATPVPVAKSAVDIGDPNRIAVAAGHRDSSYVDLLDIRQREFVQSYKDSETLGLCLNMAFVRTSHLPVCLCGAFEDGSLRWWDLRIPDRPLPNFCLKSHSEPVLCFDIDTTNGHGVSAGADASLCIFRFDSTMVHRIKSVELPNSGIADLKIRQDKKLFVSAGWDHRIRVYSWKKHSALAILRYHEESVSCVDFPTNPSDGKFLLAGGSKDKRISLWDIYND